MKTRILDWLFPATVLFGWTLATAYTLGLALA